MTDLQVQAERLYNIRKYARESGIKTNRAEVSILTRFSISEQAELMDMVVRMELAEM